MEMQFKITKINHEELTDLLSLMEGAPEMHLGMDDEVYEKYRKENDCIEDVWARALLAGEKMYFSDDACDIEGIEDANEPAPGVEMSAAITEYEELRGMVIDGMVRDHIANKIESGEYVVKPGSVINGKYVEPVVEIIKQTSIRYYFGLDEILKGMSSSKCSRDVQDFINENGDMWTGYNIFQTIAFGEPIYG